jgi:hypothetical protein
MDNLKKLKSFKKVKSMYKINLSVLCLTITVLAFVSARADVPTPSPTPATAVIQVKKGGNPVPLKDALSNEGGKRTLTLNTNEVVELLREGDVKLQSSNENSVRVLDGKYLVGLAPGTESVITATKDGALAAIEGVDNFIVKVLDADSGKEITAQSTFLPYKSVKDNFGKKFAQSFFVIQVDIRNDTEDQQFIVQTIEAMIDPNQCIKARSLYGDFDVERCLDVFDSFFIFPMQQFPVRGEEVIGSAKADLNRSNRNIGFRILKFSADMGTILTGFAGVLGPDGVKGVNVLGTTVTSAANLLFPDTAADKLENLRNAIPPEDVIIQSKKSKTFNIFIPTERVFFSASWQKYIKPARDADEDAFRLKAVLDMLLVSTATGVMVDNDAPKVQVKSDDKIENLQKKFNITNLRGAFDQSVDIRGALRTLQLKVKSSDSGTQKAAKNKIINALNILKGKDSTKDLLTGYDPAKASDKSAEELLGILIKAIDEASDTMDKPEVLVQRTADISDALNK